MNSMFCVTKKHLPKLCGAGTRCSAHCGGPAAIGLSFRPVTLRHHLSVILPLTSVNYTKNIVAIIVYISTFDKIILPDLQKI